MNLSESSVLCYDTIQTIELLLNEFDRLFPLLYPVSALFYLYTLHAKNVCYIYTFMFYFLRFIISYANS